jgi:predicted enzyme related to lactoylglutathione lyase
MWSRDHTRFATIALPSVGAERSAIVNFNSLLIGSDDPDRLVAFYRKLFGEPTFSDGVYATWVLGSGAISIGAHSEVKGRNASPGRLIWNIETTDVKDEAARFKAAGATVVAEPYSFEGYPDAWIATFEDPDGNYFQLATPMEPPPADSHASDPTR